MDDKDQNQSTLVAQTEEQRQVLAGLMEQLEGIAKEEKIVSSRKRGQDKERDSLAAQMERLVKVCGSRTC